MTKTLSVTSARQQLLKLTKDISRRLDQVVLTNKGEAQAILMSMGEYNSLRAAAELVAHPEVRRASDEGFEQLRRGKGIRLAEAMPAHSAGRKKSGAVQAVKAEVVSAEPVLAMKPALAEQGGTWNELVREIEEEARKRTAAALRSSRRRRARGSAASRQADLNAD